MYICNECKEVFEEYDVLYQPLPYGMGSAYEKWHICPYCGDNDFEEAEECEFCGEWVAKESMTGGLCKDCYEGDEDE